MDGVCKCGNYKCLIQVYWKGKYYEYRRDEQGYVYTYQKAVDKLIDINKAIRSRTFNPVDFSDEQVRERRFENMMERWLEQKAEEERSNELSPATLRAYRSYNRNYFGHFSGWNVREIRFEQLERFKDNLPRTISLKTKRNILNGLHAFFIWVRKKGTIPQVPVWPGIKGDDARVMVALDIEDQAEALARFPAEHWDPFILLFETGVRMNEVCAVKVKDFNLKEGVWVVQRTYSGTKLRETTKARNKKPIPLSEKAWEIVRRHSAGRFGDDFLLINPITGKGYRYEFLYKLWRKHAGVSITPYEATRHSFLTQIGESGINTLQAKQLMRHSDIRSTEKYFHGNITKLRDVVNNRGRVRPLRSEKTEVKEK
jgi:integrase